KWHGKCILQMKSPPAHSERGESAASNPETFETSRLRERRTLMAEDRHIYGAVNSKTGLKRIFLDIRHDVEKAGSRPGLTELYKRAGYLLTLTYAPSWKEKFGKKAGTLRHVGEEEFRRTAHKINRRAARIGTEADYDEKWGHKS